MQADQGNQMSFDQARKWARKNYTNKKEALTINPKTKRFFVITPDHKNWRTSADPKQFMQFTSQKTALAIMAGAMLLGLVFH